MPQHKSKRKGGPNRHARERDTQRATTFRQDEPTFTEWKRVYQAAKRFRDAEPWTWLVEDEMFAVVNPEDGEVGYCSVMGNAGEYPSLAVYRGEEGLLSYERMRRHVEEAKVQDRSPAADPETFLDQRSLMASFEGQSDVDRRDRKVFQSLGLRFNGSHAWPILRSVEPGCLPWFLTGKECRFLTHALEQALVVALRVRDERDLLESHPGCVLTRTPGEADPDGEPVWTDEWPAWPSLDDRIGESRVYPPTEVDELRLKRLVEGADASGVWEVDIAYAPFSIEEGPRPYFPRMLLCADRTSGQIVTFHAADLDTDGAEFVEALLEAMEQRQEYPELIMVCRQSVGQLLDPVAEALGGQVVLADYLSTVEDARQAMKEHMERR